jgi:cell division protein FtsL
MVASGKKKQVIKHGARVRIARPSTPSFAGNDRARDSYSEELSEDFLRLLVRSLAALLLVFFSLSLVLNWRIRQENAVLEHLAEKHADVKAEHERLTAERSRLMNKARIIKAAARLGLSLPEKDQEHRLD